VRIVILAVPDDAIREVAGQLAASGAVGSGHVVLHLSGVLDRSALSPLSPAGAALGSLHPLRSFGSGEERLEGAFAAVEGDDRAVEEAVNLARSIGLRPFRLATGKKALYHAGAVFAANFLVTLYSRAERLLGEAGITPGEAREALSGLMAGVVENVALRGVDALTGPVARGDVETVRLHLEVLGPEDRELYRLLSRLTLELARLPGAQRRALEQVLDEPRGGR
jgi:predicted short-subunit dehydrogenase-like oxidoreductase (DUF2520 family)